MATTENYDFWYLDPAEAMANFPSMWDFNIDNIDAAIHGAATNDVALSRIPSTVTRSSTTSALEDRIAALESSALTVTELVGDEDLNDVRATGIYTEDTGDTRPGQNYPTETDPVAGSMLVVATVRRVFQLYQLYDGRLFVRAAYTDIWRDWSQLSTPGEL